METAVEADQLLDLAYVHCCNTLDWISFISDIIMAKIDVLIMLDQNLIKN